MRLFRGVCVLLILFGINACSLITNNIKKPPEKINQSSYSMLIDSAHSRLKASAQLQINDVIIANKEKSEDEFLFLDELLTEFSFVKYEGSTVNDWVLQYIAKQDEKYKRKWTNYFNVDIYEYLQGQKDTTVNILYKAQYSVDFQKVVKRKILFLLEDGNQMDISIFLWHFNKINWMMLDKDLQSKIDKLKRFKVKGELFSTNINNALILVSLLRMNLDNSCINDYHAFEENLKNTEKIILNKPYVTDIHIQFLLQHFKSLTYINLKNTKITNHTLKLLSSLDGLKFLSVPDTNITDDGIYYISKLKNITTLQLRGTKISDESLKNIALSMKSLRSLNLRFTNITSEGLELLCSLTSLTELDLSGVKVPSQDLNCLNRLTKLKELWLGGTNIVNKNLRYISSLKSLEVLHLCSTEISDEYLDSLYELSSLKKLCLNSTPVTKKGVDKLKQKLPHCKISH